MTACEERYFGGEQNVSTNKSTFTTIYNQEILAGNDSANCPLCCSLLFPFQQACLTLRLLHVILVVQVVFPMSAASSASRRSKDGLLFLKKLPQKLFFVVSLSAGLSEFSGCYTLYLLFKLFSLCQQLHQQEGAARTGSFSRKCCRKSCSLLFPFQQACLSHRLLYVVLVVQVVFPISAKRPSKKPQHKILTKQLTPD